MTEIKQASLEKSDYDPTLGHTHPIGNSLALLFIEVLFIFLFNFNLFFRFILCTFSIILLSLLSYGRNGNITCKEVNVFFSM